MSDKEFGFDSMNAAGSIEKNPPKSIDTTKTREKTKFIVSFQYNGMSAFSDEVTLESRLRTLDEEYIKQKLKEIYPSLIVSTSNITVYSVIKSLV